MSNYIKNFATKTEQDNFQPTEKGAWVTYNKQDGNIGYIHNSQIIHNLSFNWVNLTSWNSSDARQFIFFNLVGEDGSEYSNLRCDKVHIIPEGHYTYTVTYNNDFYLLEQFESGEIDLTEDKVITLDCYRKSQVTLTIQNTSGGENSGISDITVNGQSIGIVTSLRPRHTDVIRFYFEDGYEGNGASVDGELRENDEYYEVRPYNSGKTKTWKVYTQVANEKFNLKIENGSGKLHNVQVCDENTYNYDGTKYYYGTFFDDGVDCYVNGLPKNKQLTVELTTYGGVTIEGMQYNDFGWYETSIIGVNDVEVISPTFGEQSNVVFRGTSDIIDGEIAFKTYSGTQFTKTTDENGVWEITNDDIRQYCTSNNTNGFLRQLFKTPGSNILTIDEVHLSPKTPNANHIRGIFDNCKATNVLDLRGSGLDFSWGASSGNACKELFKQANFSKIIFDGNSRFTNIPSANVVFDRKYRVILDCSEIADNTQIESLKNKIVTDWSSGGTNNDWCFLYDNQNQTWVFNKDGEEVWQLYEGDPENATTTKFVPVEDAKFVDIETDTEYTPIDRSNGSLYFDLPVTKTLRLYVITLGDSWGGQIPSGLSTDENGMLYMDVYIKESQNQLIVLWA